MSNLKCIHILIAIIIGHSVVMSCTIFTAKDSQGQVWAGNNEDFWHFTFNNKLWVNPKTDSTLGYIWFSYTKNILPQGGVNEAGLFYDFNAVEASEIKDGDKKVPFPGEVGHELLLYMLGQCKTVPDVIELFEKYKMPWMNKAQMNVADKSGNLGIITADSAWITSGNYQVSTNYNLCHNDDDYKRCWRYPIAESILKTSEPNLEIFTKICDSTSQRKGVSTILSNVHNLNTGEIWFYYAWDYETPYKTTLVELLELGDTVLMFRDLFTNQKVVQAYYAYRENGFSDALVILNQIDDSDNRADMLKLLSLDVLFLDNKFVADDELVSQIIEATNHPEILKIISRKAPNKENQKKAEKKLKAISKFNINDSLYYLLIVIGVVIFIQIIKKSKKLKQG